MEQHRGRWRAAGWAAAIAFLTVLAGPSVAAADGVRFLLPATPQDAVTARIHFLPDAAEEAFAPPPPGARRIVVTGAYTRADVFAPGGFVIRAGNATSPWPQGWDGVAVVTADGRLSLHHKRRVAAEGGVYDLEDRASRRAFVALAEARRFSVIQSHLLITDGALDVRPRDGAPRHVRRLLFQMADGAVGLFETTGRAMTLYDAARALMEAVAPHKALNLDMGTYNFCEERFETTTRNCGVLGRRRTDILTNLLELTAPAD